MTAEEGSRVVLPCRTREKEMHVIVWKRGRRVLSARNTIVTRDRRFRLNVDYSLEIFPVRPEDAGKFTCQLDTDKLPEITHSLHVLYGPRVHATPKSGILRVEQGRSASMSCNASGNPQPTLLWRKQLGQMTDGRDTVAGHVLVLTRVTRSMTGVYECVADNGHGPAAVTSVHLQVQYAPEVRVGQSTVCSGVGHFAQLVCHVTSDPPAKVKWTKDGSAVRAGSMVSVEEVPESTLHVLKLSSVKATDFGWYKCKAENSLGRATGKMVLSGTPEKCVIISEAVSLSSSRYQLAWTVTSYEPLLEYKVAYRHNKYNASRYSSSSSWREVLVPVTGSTVINNTIYRQRIPLAHLLPASMYDVKVQGRNQHGWGAFSDLYHFSTTAHGEALKAQNASSAPRSCNSQLSTCAAVSTIILAYFILT